MKKELGQYYTTNVDFIFENIDISYMENSVIIEPFCGQGDLIKNIKINSILELYDIDPKYNDTVKQDTLLNPPDYNNKYIITNPPYLAKNKAKNKDIFNKYGFDDLYKIFINQICENNVLGGIIIIPINFISSNRKSDLNLRTDFLKKYEIILFKIFETPIFDDTTTAVCLIHFKKKEIISYENKLNINTLIINKKTITKFILKLDNYIIFDKLINYQIPNNIIIDRITTKNKDSIYITNICLNCLDTSDKIEMYFDTPIIDNTKNLSMRTKLSLIINYNNTILTENNQLLLINYFNEFLQKKRIKYNSLFLSNYREGNRKRITFELVYNIVAYLITNKLFQNI